MELQGLKGVWSLRQSETEAFDKFIVQSYIGETRMLAIQDEELGEVLLSSSTSTPSFMQLTFQVDITTDFITNMQTLHCGNMLGGVIIQVTASRVILVDPIDWTLVFEYSVQKSIVLASGNLQQVVLALSGGSIVYLELDLTSRALVEKATVELDHDVACLSIRPLDVALLDDTNMIISDESATATCHILVVGMWTDSTVRFLSLPTLQELQRIQHVNEMQVRDVLIVKLGTSVYLFNGMGDGALIFYKMSIVDGLPSFTNRRKVVLGTHPITLSCFYSNDSLCIFAACDSPTILYASNEKILFSVVNINEVNSVTSFNSALFPEALCLVSEGTFTIGNVNTIQKVHTQKFPLDGVPRRIIHNEAAGVFAGKTCF